MATGEMTSAGFVGLGSMGGGIARRIAKSGFPLTVWARRADVADAFATGGIGRAATLAELGGRCDYVGLCVLDDDAVIQVCAELLPAMREGSLLAVHSTILPETCAALEGQCDKRKVRFLDAPVDGSGHDAEQGVLTVMCGGRQAAIEAAQPILDAIGNLVVHLGPAGAGQKAKIICNSLLAADLGLAHAAMKLGDSFGLDRAQLHEVLRNGAAQSYGLDLYPKLSGPRQAPLLYKDVGLMVAAEHSGGNARTIASAASVWLNSDKEG